MRVDGGSVRPDKIRACLLFLDYCCDPLDLMYNIGSSGAKAAVDWRVHASDFMYPRDQPAPRNQQRK